MQNMQNPASGLITTERKNLIIEVAKKSAQLILQNGGETYRAEDTCSRICLYCGAKEVDVLAITTGIVLTVEFQTSARTVVARISNRSINLQIVNKVNTISRNIISGELSLESANDILDEIIQRIESGESNKPINRFLTAVYAAFASSFFTLVFKGSFVEFLITILTAFSMTIISGYIGTLKLYSFINTLISSVACAVFAVSSSLLIPGLRYDLVIIGSIMPLVPGLAITTAVRDTISGDLVSGTARLTEAFLIAVGIAAGVGIVIGIAIAAGVIA
ncbi:MAG: threonine/serine exporter family protein [Oscillospiraceae bacterium]|nr:threonine/serine exporter family protein [Oscillospiraceae bacterium]